MQTVIRLHLNPSDEISHHIHVDTPLEPFASVELSGGLGPAIIAWNVDDLERLASELTTAADRLKAAQAAHAAARTDYLGRSA